MTGQRVAQLKRLLRTDKIQVRKIVVAAHEKKADSVYVFFDHVAEETEKERETLKRLKAEGERVAEDEIYQKLSNSKQRELYLLDHYGLSKKESADVVELVKIAEVVASVSNAMVNNEEEQIRNGSASIK
jgi:hypothetical protein